MASGAGIGVRFSTRTPTVRAAVERIVVAIRTEWDHAREVVHPSHCC